MINSKTKRRLTWILPAGALITAALAWLAFGYFGVHTLFIDDEVNEAGPVFDSGAVAAGSGAGEPATPVPEPAEPTSAAPPQEATASEPRATPDTTPEPTPTTAPATEVVTLNSGDFIDRSHPTAGIALVLNDGTDQRFLRFEDFETDNGPDLNVYLSAAPPDAPAGDFDDDFVDLGDLKGNIGPQNYEIPPDVDLDRYGTVVIWCVRFAVAFGAAELSPDAGSA